MAGIFIHGQLVILIPIGFFLFYLMCLTLLALIAKQRTEFDVPRKCTFAIVIPAHNEEAVIAKTIASVFEIDYEKERYSVIVVADNCTDGTAALAAQAGAIVHERVDTTLRGKGYALRWIFDQLTPQKKYDAVVVIDADSTMSKNFLTVMNYYLYHGALSLQSTDIVERGPSSWSAAMIRISFLLFNYVRPLGRHVIRLPMSLRGNGMCFNIQTLREVPWNAFTLAEDVDYGLQLLLMAKPTYFAPEALVYATMPQQLANAQSQRARWEGGRALLIRKYSGSLLKEFLKKKSYKYFDAFVDLVTPSIVNMVALVGCMFILNCALVFLGFESALPYVIYWFFAGFCGIFHLFLGLYAVKAERDLYWTLLRIPQYFMWKIGVYLHIFKGKNQGEWIRTKRETAQSPSDHITL